MEDRFLLNSRELILWCRERKKALGLSNQKLAELCDVPIGTVDRVMSGNYNEYKYSSIQPIVSYLIGFGSKIPEPPKVEEEQGEYYYETVEGYKMVLRNKNQFLAQASAEYDACLRENKALKIENDNKQRIIDALMEHLKWLEEHL